MILEGLRARRASVSRPLQRASLGIAAALLAACSSIDPSPPLDDSLTDSALPVLLRAPAAARRWEGPTGCTGRRWISARTPPSSLGRGWTSRRVFPHVPAGIPMAQYHVLEWTSRVDPDVAGLVAAYRAAGWGISDWTSRPELLAPDCVIVGPLGGPSPSVDVLQGLRRWDVSSFRERTRAGAPVPLGDHPVQIAILDSSPDNDGDGDIPLGASSHGYTMGWIAREMACGAPPSETPGCSAEIRTYLALPRVTNESATEAGGYFGTPGDLAEAVDRAVEGWKQSPPPRPRLVINLSLGWQPEIGRQSGGVDINGAAAPAQSVLDALRRAACHGALIVAAAGNEPGNPSSRPGATYPAAWQGVAAPRRSECEREFGMLVSEPLASEGNPPGVVPEPSLVVAVGGTNYLGDPMVVTRLGSVGRLVAPALHGAAGDAVDPPIPALTGTSVSAAVLSGVAALVWAHRPDLNPTAVLAQLYSFGTPITITSGLRLLAYLADHPEVREVDRCTAAAAIAASCLDGEACPEVPPCEPWSRLSASIPPPPEVLGTLETWFDGFTAPSHATVHPSPPFTQQNQLTAPWVHPQPDTPPCGAACILDLAANFLYVSIDPAVTLTLSDMVLTVRHEGAGGTGIEDSHFPVTGVAMSGGDTLGVSLSGMPSERAIEARLTWKVTDPNAPQVSTATEAIKMIGP
ncbi:uncharacterized protein SOCE26_073610 [Sorangium cellulosum]|uniref:Peptidase S8/S53 domain-containing protein n=1 Tax=Sorangium cellulosum TaxID=56 RepID=A0A2L0F2R6_SORCE|nr:S8/S53 family peptidase [Sorangium cellulosum]AUX45865.1 uncharacterized protein SOCE26_073610 [Sorangium cellulosum]